MLHYFLLLQSVLSDEMFWYDYNTGYEYSWTFLQQKNDYIIETPSEIIKFNLGKEISSACEGQFASAISFPKSGEKCEILARHQLTFYTPFETPSTTGLVVFYEGGSICRNRLYDNFKRRVEFKFTCSSIESGFTLANSLDDCTTIFEKQSLAGCPQDVEYSVSMRILAIL